MYQIVNTINVGGANSGRSINAQIYDSSGVATGGVISSGFSERPGGTGIVVHVVGIQDAHLGWIDYFFADTPGVVIGTLPINPREIENSDVRTSSRSVAGDIPSANTIADTVLGRSVSNAEGAAGLHSLTELILAILESSTASGSWVIKKTDGTTTFNTRTLATDADAVPIVGVS